MRISDLPLFCLCVIVLNFLQKIAMLSNQYLTDYRAKTTCDSCFYGGGWVELCAAPETL